MLRVPERRVPAVRVVAAAAERGVALSAVGPRVVRAVTHLDVTRAQCEDAGVVLAQVLLAEGLRG